MWYLWIEPFSKWSKNSSSGRVHSVSRETIAITTIRVCIRKSVVGYDCHASSVCAFGESTVAVMYHKYIYWNGKHASSELVNQLISSVEPKKHSNASKVWKWILFYIQIDTKARNRSKSVYSIFCVATEMTVI